MADGWKQVWQDLLDSLRGAPARAEDGSVEAPTEEVADAPQAAPDVLISDEAPLVELAPIAEALPAAQAEQPDMLEIAPEAESAAASERSADDLRVRRVRRVLYAIIGVGALVWLGTRLAVPKPPASDVVATFDGGQITLADLEAHLKLLLPEQFQAAARSPETLVLVVQDMVMDELVRRWASQRQPDTDENFRHSMQHITEELNLESFESQLHEDAIPVAESEIRAYYDANREQFGELSFDAVREQIRQILVAEGEQQYVQDYIQRLKDNASITRNFDLLAVPAPTEDDLRRYYDANADQFKLPRQAVVQQLEFPIGVDEAAARQEADDALLKLRSGADFVQVSQEFPRALLLVGAAVAEGTRDPTWDAAVFELTAAELSNVFRAGDSFFIVQLLEEQAARTQTLDEVRVGVRIAVEGQLADEWFQANAGKTLFTLKSQRYTVGEFYQEYRELPLAVQAQYAGPQGMAQLAELLIARLLLVEDTYAQLLDVQNQPLEDEARLQLLRQMLHQEEVDDQIEIGEDEIQQFYDDNIELMALPPQARIRYIRIGLGASEDEAQRARERADEAYKKLVPGFFQQGEDFATVAQEYSEDPDTAANGGEFPGWVGESEDILAEIQLHPFHEAVLTLQPEEISPPFEFGGSLYIVQVIERTEPETLTLEQAKPYVEEILFQQRHDEQNTQLQERLLEEANFAVFWQVLEDYYTRQLPTPEFVAPQP